MRSDSPDNAKRKIEKEAELVQRRIKAIKLADKREYGWATGAEYLSDELESDEDDEKCTFRF